MPDDPTSEAAATPTVRPTRTPAQRGPGALVATNARPSPARFGTGGPGNGRRAGATADRSGVYPRAVLDLLEAGGDRPVFEHGDRVVSAAAMLRLIRRVVAGLRAAAIGPGTGVALLLGVSPEAFAAIIAAHAVGARVSGIRPGLPADQLAHLLRQGIDVVVTDAEAGTPAGTPVEAATPAGTPAGGTSPEVTTAAATMAVATTTGGTTAEPAPKPTRPSPVRVPAGVPVLHLSDLVGTPDDGQPVRCAGRPEDIARIIYTSGSTGMPKGCAQSYAALGAAWTARPDRWPPAIRALAERLRRYLVFGSLSSQVMMEYGVLTLASGGTMVVAGPPAFPDAIARYRATASVITVPKLNRLVLDQRARPADLTSLRALLVSGSPLDPGRLREAIEVLGPVVFHGYGQTETGMIAMLTPAEMVQSPGTLATVGRPPEVTDVEIRDAAGRRLPAGAEGELFVRTPAQASGYWDDPAESAEVFVDGWVRTRDLARLDLDGHLRLMGRLRDVIIVNANLVYAGPIERLLASHRDVAEAYVVGAPDERTGEAAHAFVVPAEPRRRLEVDGLRALVARRLGDAAVPRTVTAIERVPIAASGKPDKHLLAAHLLATGTGEPATGTGRRAGKGPIGIVRRATGTAELGLGSPSSESRAQDLLS